MLAIRQRHQRMLRCGMSSMYIPLGVKRIVALCPDGRRSTLVAPSPGVASAPVAGGGGAPVVGGGGHAGSLPRATLLATAVFPMPDTVRSISTSRGVVAVVAHEQKLELVEWLL